MPDKIFQNDGTNSFSGRRDNKLVKNLINYCAHLYWNCMNFYKNIDYVLGSSIGVPNFMEIE